jgi:hypothetical protein
MAPDRSLIQLTTGVKMSEDTQNCTDRSADEDKATPMARYIGTKIIHASPRAKNYGPPEHHGEPGYTVVYPDGYTSWSPAVAFEEAYRKCDALNFGLALEAMKKGLKVARSGWNGSGMFCFLVQGSKFTVNRAPLLGIYPEGTEITYRPHIDLKTADGSIATWSPSGSDALAEDWIIVD